MLPVAGSSLHGRTGGRNLWDCSAAAVDRSQPPSRQTSSYKTTQQLLGSSEVSIHTKTIDDGSYDSFSSSFSLMKTKLQATAPPSVKLSTQPQICSNIYLFNISYYKGLQMFLMSKYISLWGVYVEAHGCSLIYVDLLLPSRCIVKWERKYELILWMINPTQHRPV